MDLSHVFSGVIVNGSVMISMHVVHINPLPLGFHLEAVTRGPHGPALTTIIARSS